jgi:ABC-type multidrug transport system permease subunit
MIGDVLLAARASKIPEVATGVSFAFILPQMFFGTFIPITSMTRQITMFIPSYYVVDVLTLIFAGDWMNPNILIDISVISSFSAVIIVLGIVLFRKYGNI